VNSSDRQSEAFFEARYRTSSDPWRFSSATYELNRYRATLDALSRPNYARGFEPGCSIGVLTAALAGRVKHLIACDIAETAVARAKERCREFRNVEIHHRNAAQGPPDGTFDLMVFSELGYYFSVNQLTDLTQQMVARLAAGGEFVAVHWLGTSSDHLLHGDVVHEVLADNLRCDWIGGSRYAGFRIDSWRQTPC
jgi:protein-L-isoaspartate O-methyltransferase